jgi:hypothetical protein
LVLAYLDPPKGTYLVGLAKPKSVVIVAMFD